MFLRWNTFFQMSYYLLLKDNMEHKKYVITINPTPIKSKPSKSDKSIGIIYNNLNIKTGVTANEFATIVQQPYGYTYSCSSD
jgi:hypothetical protein